MTKKELITLGEKYYKQYSKLPKFPQKTESNWKKYNGYTSIKTITDVFDSWNNFINELSPKGYHVDHIKPLAKGSLHILNNLQYLTATENLRKGDKYNGL